MHRGFNIAIMSPIRVLLLLEILLGVFPFVFPIERNCRNLATHHVSTPSTLYMGCGQEKLSLSWMHANTALEKSSKLNRKFKLEREHILYVDDSIICVNKPYNLQVLSTLVLFLFISTA